MKFGEDDHAIFNNKLHNLKLQNLEERNCEVNHVYNYNGFFFSNDHKRWFFWTK
jgi:hypothetical protein